MAVLFVAGVFFASIPAVRADLEGQIFTSPPHRIRVTVPKGWRASDLASYPGILLWMLRSQPEGRIVVGAEPLTQQLFCSWPEVCRTLALPLSTRYACAVREQLKGHNISPGPLEAGPKENVAAGLPSVWFEFSDGKSFVRQAIAANEERAVTVLLSTGKAADRSTHARSFDQVLRSLRQLSEQDVEPAPAQDSAPPGDDAAASPAPPPSAAAARASADASTRFDPSRPCP